MHRHAAAATLAMLLMATGPVTPTGAATDRVGTAPRHGLATGFEMNVGQFDSRLDAVARHGNLLISLSAGDATLRLMGRSDAITLTLVGRSRPLSAHPGDRLPLTINRYRGTNSRQWHSQISTFSQVRYRDVYRGVDLIYYFDAAGRLEHDFVVAPGASPRVIRLRIDGARTIAIDRAGDLRLALADGEIVLRRPVVYQRRGDERQPVEGRYVTNGARDIGFEVGSHDRARPLWIDPVIDYSTYLGGIGTDEALDVAVDAEGNAYATGFTQSPDFPTENAWQPTLEGWQDAFVAKFDAGGVLRYCTFLGGSRSDRGHGIAVASGGAVHVVGETFTSDGTSTDFPVTPGAFQTAGRYRDVFVARLDAGGSLVAATLLGGAASETGTAIAVDAAGNSYVTGWTYSDDFPVLSAIQPVRGGLDDAFATKLNPDLTGLAYSTYFGGSRTELGHGVAVDAAGNLAIVGATVSDDLPTANAFQPARAGSGDGFVARLSPSGSAFVFSTYFGGRDEDEVTAIAVDVADIVVGGFTKSPDLPAAGDSAIAGPPSPINGYYEDDAFVAKLTASGVPVYSTYLGGNSADRVDDIVIGRGGAIYVTGPTRSTTLPAATDRLADAGAFTSTDGGTSWTAVKDGLESASLTALVIDPAQPDTLYAGTERDGVFKSTDGGATWTRVNNGLTSLFVTALGIDPVNTSTLYAATQSTGAFRTVSKTVDGGASWTAAAGGILIPYAMSLAIDPSNPSTVYVGTAMRGHERLYRTIDGGASWSVVLYRRVPAVAVDPSTSSTVYAASSVFLYKTVDGGSTWSVVFTEETHLAPLTAALIDPSSPSIVYVGTSGEGVFKSTDGGTTWAAASVGLASKQVTTLALDPGNPATVYAGTADAGVFKSADGGATWSPLNSGIADTYVAQIAVNPRQPSQIHVGIDGLYGDAYLAVLTAEGKVVSSAHAGGSRYDSGRGIAVAPSGVATLTGVTRSRDWPTSADALRPLYGGGYFDGFLSRLACVAPLALTPVRVSPSVLWPPDHRLVAVSLDYEAWGGCGPAACTVAVTSNEPTNGTGDGDAAPDWEVLDARRVRLRAERAGYGPGRTYTVTVSCADASGGQGEGSQTVAVPISSR